MEGVLKPQSPGGLVSRSRIASSPPFFLGDILVQCKNEGRKGSGYATTGVALILSSPLLLTLSCVFLSSVVCLLLSTHIFLVLDCV